ncbi:MAG: TIGR03084 family metal-binding protein [Desulfatirhabdiaceae bacterium]
MDTICRDMESEYQELDDVVSSLDMKEWNLDTPFYRWTIFDEIAHIAFFDHEALLAVDMPDYFKARSRNIMQILKSNDDWPAYTNILLGPEQPNSLLLLWRKTRTALINRLSRMDPRDRILWYGPDMSVRSFATARLMETWAHGQDVFDALRLQRTYTHRLLHVAHIGVTTFAWSFKIRKLSPPETEIRVELTGPGGELWTWGDPEALEQVHGSAEDFCLVVTQRRNFADTRLECRGVHVTKWLSIAQAFAGIQQNPPAPGERVID